MATQTRTAGSALSGGVGTAWSGTGNTTTNDGSYATVVLDASQSEQSLFLSNFGFTIPSGSTIDGITVSLKHYASGSNVFWLHMQLSLDGEDKGTAGTGEVSTLLTTEGTTVAGGSSDTWDVVDWTSTDINSSLFGIDIDCLNGFGGGARTVYLNYVTIAIDYTAPVAASGVQNSLIQLGCGI